MKKIALAVMAAVLGMASIATVPTAASAGWKGKNNNYHHNNNTWTVGPGVGFAAGAIVGLGVGALATAPRRAPAYYAPAPRYYAPPAPVYYQPPPPPPVYYPRRAWTRAHIDWCLANYRSYNPATDTFMGYDGYAHRCISPY